MNRYHLVQGCLYGRESRNNNTSCSTNYSYYAIRNITARTSVHKLLMIMCCNNAAPDFYQTIVHEGTMEALEPALKSTIFHILTVRHYPFTTRQGRKEEECNGLLKDRFGR